jgi:dTDP-4-dehydrorhamnose reductase
VAGSNLESTMSETAVAPAEAAPELLAAPRPIPSRKLRLLVTGASGMLGSDLVPVLAGAGFEVFARSKAELDITSEAQVTHAFHDIRPEIVVNCAAYTRVDACETDPLAFEVNARGVDRLAKRCIAQGARLVQISTDFVFDGKKREPYVEDDSVAPLSAYGRSKQEGEEAALRAPAALVVRSSWLFGRGGWNFIEAILKQVESGRTELKVVTDQRGRPTGTSDLAQAILALLDAGATGIYHFANRGEVSWYEFTQAILMLSEHPDVRVLPIDSGQLDRPATRPTYSALDTTKYERLIGRRVRHFGEALLDYLSLRRQPEA